MGINPDKLKVVKELNRPDILLCLARQPESNRLFVGSTDFKIYDLDVLAEKPEPKELAGHESYVTGVVMAGNQIVSGGYDGRLIWWDAETREQIRTIDAHQKWIRGLNISTDGKTIASVADDMVCRLWNAESGEKLKELQGHEAITPHHFPSMLYCSAISPDNQLVATADKVGHIVVWKIATGEQLATMESPTMYTWDPKQRIHSIGGIRSLAFSPDGKLLAAGGMGQVGNIDHLGAESRVEVFDWEKGERTHELVGGDKFKGLVQHLQFDADGKWLLGAGGDNNGFLQFFDLEANKVGKQEKAPMHIHDLAVNETFDTLYAAGHSKIVVWEMKE